MSAKTNDTTVQAPILLRSAHQKLKPVPEGVHIAYVPITVRFLDDTPPLEFTIDKLTNGQELLERVCEHLQLLEKGYFGMRFDGADNERYWLDVKRPVAKQLKLAESNVVHFRVRYYPVFAALREEITRYQLFLQLRRDLYRGRLLCPLSDAYELAALILQSEVGDYDVELCKPGYVSEFPLLPRQNSKVEERISEMHKTMTGMTPAEAENRLLKLASRCDTYGVDPFGVRPSNETSLAITRNVAVASGKSVEVPVSTLKREEPSKVTGSKSGDTLPNTASTPSWFMGVNHNGVVLFASSRATHVFKWYEIAKLTTSGRLFVVHTHVAAIPTSQSFGTAPLAERDENKPTAASDVATNGESKANEATLENGDGERRASQTKATRSGSLRDTKNEREEPLLADDKVVEPPPNANRSATLRSISRLSRISTLQRNSFNTFKQKLQQSNDLEPKTTAYEFRCDSPAAAKSLWLIAVDQQAFFTLQSSEAAKRIKSAGGLFARSAKFRFSGRCERELSEELSSIKRTEPRFERAASTRIAAEIRTRRPPSIRDDQLDPTNLLNSILIEDVKSDESDLLRTDDTKRTVSSTDSDKRTATRSSTDSLSGNVEQIVAATVAQTEVRAQVRIVDAVSSANDNGDVAADGRTALNDQESDQKREREHDADTDQQDQRTDNSQSSSSSTANAVSLLVFYASLLFLTLIVFFTVLYETEYLEQTAKRVVGVSLRKNIALERLAQLTYKPVKQVALSLLKAVK